MNNRHERGNNPYATLKSGKIEAPKKQKNQPRSSVIRGNDLRKGK